MKKLREKFLAGAIMSASILTPVLTAPGVSATSVDSVYVPDGIYVLWSQGGLQFIEWFSSGARIGTAAQDYRYFTEKFKVQRGSDGYYTISSTKSGKVLDVSGGSRLNGARLQFWDANGTCAQKWIFQLVGGTTYTIRNACSGKAVDITAGMISRDDTQVQMWEPNGTKAQKWNLQRLDGESGAISSSGSTALKVSSGKAADIAGALLVPGRNVRVWDANGTIAQTFKVQKYDDGSVSFNDAFQNLALDVAGASKANGANVQMWFRNGTCAQKWFPRKTGTTYTLLNGCSGKALDVSGGAIDNLGTNIQIWESNGTKAQKWALNN